VGRTRARSGGSTGGSEELRFDFGATEAPPEPGADGERPQVSSATAPSEEPQADNGHPAREPEPRPQPAPVLSVVSDQNVEARASGLESDAALSVSEFYERVKGAIRRAFPEEVWVTGEIRKATESRGHHYLELADFVENTGDAAPAGRGGPAGKTAPAALEVACWARDWPAIAYELDAVGVELAPGLVVRVRGKVSVWEGGSKLRFTMTALDVEALVGGIAAARRRLLQALDAEGLLEANRRLTVPLVPLRIGLVTSPGSEAYRDFTGQLARSGYVFDVRLEPSLVQGSDAPLQLAGAIGRLGEFAPDLIVVVRGGGARGDLAAFDTEPVARAIATSPFPVWTGIGHTGDRSVADEVAQRALVTPTQCGEAVVAAVATYLDGVDRRARNLARRIDATLDGASRANRQGASSLRRAARQQLDRSAADLLVSETGIAHGALIAIERARGHLTQRSQRLIAPSRNLLDSQARQLSHSRELLKLFDPRRQLERGWSLTRGEDGRIVRSVVGLSGGDRLTTTFADGVAHSVIEATAPTPTGQREATNQGDP
jgi:exodeoxyribonuclease VII large subunit